MDDLHRRYVMNEARRLLRERGIELLNEPEELPDAPEVFEATGVELRPARPSRRGETRPPRRLPYRVVIDARERPGRLTCAISVRWMHEA